MDILQDKVSSQINPELIKAFHLMWDGFPWSASLVRKDRTVLACNAAAFKRGYRVGSRCFQASGRTSVHKQCMANEAMRDQVGHHSVNYNPERNAVSDAYWLPIAGEKDIYVHTVINITDVAKPELFKE